MTTSIRAMRWWDIPRVHRIEQICFPRDCWSVDQFWRELSGDTRDYLVAERDSTVVGYAGVATIAPDSDLQTLAVDPANRGSGAGGLLLQAVLECANARHASSMLLEVRSDNDDARRLYERMGFQTIATRRRYYSDGSDALIMRRRPIDQGSMA
ncbi:MAG: ribosomal protein S18-alanine N-acetyltransferase [Candidatus Nanopelagicales bacterium]